MNGWFYLLIILVILAGIFYKLWKAEKFKNLKSPKLDGLKTLGKKFIVGIYAFIVVTAIAIAMAFAFPNWFENSISFWGTMILFLIMAFAFVMLKKTSFGWLSIAMIPVIIIFVIATWNQSGSTQYDNNYSPEQLAQLEAQATLIDSLSSYYELSGGATIGAWTPMIIETDDGPKDGHATIIEARQGMWSGPFIPVGYSWNAERLFHHQRYWTKNRRGNAVPVGPDADEYVDFGTGGGSFRIPFMSREPDLVTIVPIIVRRWKN